jgi:hypothetical protein
MASPGVSVNEPTWAPAIEGVRTDAHQAPAHV